MELLMYGWLSISFQTRLLLYVLAKNGIDSSPFFFPSTNFKLAFLKSEFSGQLPK